MTRSLTKALTLIVCTMVLVLVLLWMISVTPAIPWGLRGKLKAKMTVVNRN